MHRALPAREKLRHVADSVGSVLGRPESGLRKDGKADQIIDRILCNFARSSSLNSARADLPENIAIDSAEAHVVSAAKLLRVVDTCQLESGS